MARTVDPDMAFKSIYGLLKKDKDARRAVQANNVPAMKQLLRTFGLDPNDQQNITDLLDMSQLFRTAAQEATDEQEVKDKAELEKSKAREDYKDAVKTIMSLDPRTKLLYTALDAGGEVAHAMANNARNNGNRLAQAILEGNRDHSAEQDRLYGPSIRDKSNAMVAADTARRGENAGNVWDALGNIVHKALGMEKQNDLTTRQMQMIPYDRELNMPGNYYQAMSQDRKRALNN